MLATEPLERITIRRLTKEIGVAPANFYNHFDSLDELLFRIAAGSLNAAVDRAMEIWRGPGAKADLLVSSAIDFIRFCLRNGELMRLMLRWPRHARYDECRAASSRSLGEIVRFIYGENIEPGSPPVDNDRYGMAFGYIALSYGFALILASGRFGIDVEDEAELSRFVRNGILPFLDGSAAALSRAS